MADVFISYSREDRSHVRQLAEALQLRGRSVWWDQRILTGTSFDQTIERALGEARCVVVLWSAASVASRWVRTEAAEALHRDIILPARLDDATVPLEFRHIQTSDLTEWRGEPDNQALAELLEDVDRVLGVSSANPTVSTLRPGTATYGAFQTRPVSTDGASSILALRGAVAFLVCLIAIAILVRLVLLAPSLSVTIMAPLSIGLGAWLLALVGGIMTIRFIFSEVDNNIPPHLKRRAAEWIESRPPDLILKFANLFRDAFDAVFGTRHLSWRCFGRSCLASYALVGLLTLLWLAFHFETVARSLDTRFGEVALWATAVLFVNVWPDYLSLLKTRQLISHIRSDSSTTSLAFTLILDAAMTIAISFMALWVAPHLGGISYRGAILVLEWLPSLATPQSAIVAIAAASETIAWFTVGAWNNFPAMLALKYPYTGIPLGVLFYSTFFTSMWLWLYLIAAKLVTWQPTIRRTWRVLAKAHDLTRQPFASLGDIGEMVFVVVMLSLLPIVVLRAIL